MAFHSRTKLGGRARLALAGLMLALCAPLASADSDIFVCIVGNNFSNTSGFFNYGLVGNVRAYSIETNACNQGSTYANWVETTSQHPVIAQNLFRLRSGRFEQVGQSWLKHGFFADEENGCTTCNPSGDFSKLGPGCCDTYGASLNGFQSLLGPKSEVNASTGVFPYPFCSGGCPTPSTAVDRRLQVLDSDMDPDPSVIYIVEIQYVLPDDCQAANRSDWNNASWRQIGINSSKNLSFWLSSTVPGEPAIKAWMANDAGVNLAYVDVPNDGRYWVGAKATSLGNGTWHYEYAVHNLSSDRSGGSFTVPIPVGATISNVGFHNVFYHSGEPYDPADWSLPANGVATTNALTWASQPYPSDPANANALRWGTLYNFRFDANVPPETGAVTIGLFKPGSPTTASIGTVAPRACACLGDMNGDGKFDGNDIPPFIRAFLGSAPSNCADLVAPTSAIPDDADLAQFVSLLLGAGTCP